MTILSASIFRSFHLLLVPHCAPLFLQNTWQIFTPLLPRYHNLCEAFLNTTTPKRFQPHDNGAKRKNESQYLKIFERKKCSKYHIDSSYRVFLMHAYTSETHITIHFLGFCHITSPAPLVTCHGIIGNRML